ncbi:MAG: hypothetical protein J0M08_11515 [Bacteroidetes bacterium]|nr:hypothetical protein [Bacteroidota bacterium]
MIDNTTYDLIERYLDNDLTPQEKLEVEKRIVSDADFKAEFDAHQAANNIIVDNALVNIKQQLAQIHSNNTKPSKLNGRRILSIAAIVALFTTFVLVYKNSNRQTEPNSIVQPAIKNSQTEIATQDSSVTTSHELSPETQNTIVSEKKISSSSKTIEPSPEKKEEAKLDEQAPVTRKDEPSKPNNSNNYSQTSSAQSNSAESNKTNVPVANENSNNEKNVCDGVQITPVIDVISSCQSQQNGIITLSQESQNAFAPFEYSIDNGKNYYSSGRFENLANGVYKISIRDSRNCKSEVVSQTVDKQDCNYVLYPLQQKYWEVPVNRFNGFDVQLRIRNGRTGVVVYQTTISSNTFTWTGDDIQGIALPMGVYVYELSSTQSNIQQTGQITIVK